MPSLLNFTFEKLRMTANAINVDDYENMFRKQLQSKFTTSSPSSPQSNTLATPIPRPRLPVKYLPTPTPRPRPRQTSEPLSIDMYEFEKWK